MTNFFSLKAALNKFLTTVNVTPYVFYRTLPQDPSYPATVYEIIDQVAVGRSHSKGVLPFREARVQIDVYAETVPEAEAAIEQYFQQMGHFDGSFGVAGFTDISCRFDSINPDMSFEQEPTLRQIEGRSMDFKVLYK